MDSFDPYRADSEQVSLGKLSREIPPVCPPFYGGKLSFGTAVISITFSDFIRTSDD